MNTIDATTAEKLRQTIAKIERLNNEKSELSSDISEVYSEAKSFGFDTKVLRAIIKDRKMEPDALEEKKTIQELYEDALSQ